jgi:hypothetical protein
MSQITNTVFWKTNSNEREDAIIFRKNLDAILDKVSDNKVSLTKEEEETYQHLQQATIYAKTQMLNKESKALYESKATEDNQTAYTIAVADFLNAPDIKEVDLRGYTGKQGDLIRVQVTDDFKVAFVKVSIITQSGGLLESGEALQQNNSSDWLYTTQADNSHFDGDKILIQASDLPGNVSEKEQPILK